MCFIALPRPPVQQLIVAAQHIQNLMENGTLAAAFSDGNQDQTATAITGFDRLQEAATRLAGEQKAVTPFLRYRREILADNNTAAHLRDLVLNLWGGRPANLSLLFMGADEHHTRVALECIASYSTHGENDSQFMMLSSEIAEIVNRTEEVAA